MRVVLPVVPLTDNFLGIFLPNPFLINRFFYHIFSYRIHQHMQPL